MREQGGEVAVEFRLVALDEHEVIAARVHDLLAQPALAGQGIAREYASLVGDERGGGGEFGGGFVTTRRDGHLREHETGVVTDGTEHVDRTGREQLPCKSAPLGFAVHRHPLRRVSRFVGSKAREGAAERVGEQVRVEAGKQASKATARQ